MARRCRGSTCGQMVLWAQHEATGAWAPFDEDEAVTAPKEVRYKLQEDTMKGGLWAVRASVGERGVLSHHATCPNAGDF